MKELTTELSFSELTDDLNEKQGDYLALRVKGINRDDALKIIGRHTGAYTYWAGMPEFLAIEKHLIENREHYIIAADNHFSDKIARIEMGLMNLASRVADWGRIEEKDKGHVLRACSLLKKMQKAPKKESYEERLKQARKQIT